MELYQIKLCPYIGAGKYECGKPVSIIGTPGTRKTLLFGGANVSIRLNNVLKSITMHGLVKAVCSSVVCGAAVSPFERKVDEITPGEFGKITFIPTNKAVQELHAVEPVSAHLLNVPSLSQGSGCSSPLMLGPDNQILVHSGQTRDTYFYTLADGSAVIEPTKTEKLTSIGYSGSSGPQEPAFYDGAQIWLAADYTCRDVYSSLDYNTKWMIVLDTNWDYSLRNGLAAANNVLWHKDDQNSYASFSLYDIPTRTFLRKFNTFEHSVAAKNYGNDIRFFTPSLDGTILYLVAMNRQSKLLTILGTCTALLCVMYAARAFVPFGMRSMRLHATTLPEGLPGTLSNFEFSMHQVYPPAREKKCFFL